MTPRSTLAIAILLSSCIMVLLALISLSPDSRLVLLLALLALAILALVLLGWLVIVRRACSPVMMVP
ncbi:hypothetical protein DRO32_01615 [Candidatus Bathyarchaeota archaeon]|nr:MAG: hypothetical protein DRO32_01615 [Candidatus Bathyarchaeota archaeon]